MSATLEELISDQVRSRRELEVIDYLKELVREKGQLPSYYPDHLRGVETQQAAFDEIRQIAQVVEDRSRFDQWRARQRERTSAAVEHDTLAYIPGKARPELGDGDMLRVEPAPQIFKWNEKAGEKFKRAVLLGDPGFGKTWLLRYESRRLAREALWALSNQAIALDEITLPLYIGLPVLNAWLREHNKDLKREDDRIEAALVSEAGKGRSGRVRSFVSDKLRSGGVVVLLDAWDEVPLEEAQEENAIQYKVGYRQWLGERIRDFSGRFERSRILMTSRIVGYGGSPIPMAKELELLAFDKSQVEAVVRVWFGEGTETANQFLALLRNNIQVSGLARIPLMLALMCRSYQEERLVFPSQRGQLYERCLRGLLREWKEEKAQREISNADVDAVLELLQAIGYRLFAEGREQFTESHLRNVTGECLEGLPPTHELCGTKPASVIARLKRDGVLITAGEHRDAPLLFLHRTFHEYLTACQLAQQAKKHGWKAIASLVDENSWLPLWQHVIVLLAGKLENPVPLLKLLKSKNRDDLFRPRLCLAAGCASEILITSDRTKSKLSDLAEGIAYELFGIWWRAKGHGAEFAHIARSLPSITYSDRVLSSLKERIATKDSAVQSNAAVALAAIGEPAAGREGVIQALLNALRGGEILARSSSAFALGRIGEALAEREAVVIALLNALQDDAWEVRSSAAVALGEMRAAIGERKDVITVLVDIALQDTEEIVRTSAAFTLGLAAVDGEGVIIPLLNALRDDSWEMRSRAAVVLGEMGNALSDPTEVITSLLDALRDDVSNVSGSAALALGRFGAQAAEREDVIIALLDALQEGERNLRRSAAVALGEMGAAAAESPAVLTTLVEIALRDQHADNRTCAVETLGRIGPRAAENEDVITALLYALRDDLWKVRGSAAAALGRVGAVAAEREDVIPALLKVLLLDKDEDARSSAALAFGEMGGALAGREDVILALVNALRDEHVGMRSIAAEALGRIGPRAAEREDVTIALLYALQDKVEDVRNSAVKAVGGFLAQGFRFFRGDTPRWNRFLWRRRMRMYL